MGKTWNLSKTQNLEREKVKVYRLIKLTEN